MDVPPLPPIDVTIAIIIVIFFAVGLHEYAHCKMADAAGDPTPGVYGRVTLNLTKHFEPMGTIMMFFTAIAGVGIGWGRAAPMDPNKMRNPRWDFFIAVIAGPLSNILQAGVWAILFRMTAMWAPDLLLGSAFLENLLFFGIMLNLRMAFFNLIPLGPLDGHWLLGLLIPEKPRYYWFRFNRMYGQYGLIALILISQMLARNGGPNFLGTLINPPVEFLFRLFTGIKDG